MAEATCTDCSRTLIKQVNWYRADLAQRAAWSKAGLRMQKGHGLCVNCYTGQRRRNVIPKPATNSLSPMGDQLMYVTAKDGKKSALPPMRELAARCRDGENFRDIAAELGVAYSTLTARFSQAGFATTGESVQQAQRRELRESRGREDRPLWMAKGACLDHYPDLWFADPGHAQALAKEICNGCPSRQECLDWAIETNQQYGIFGGLGREERVNLKRRETYRANMQEAS